MWGEILKIYIAGKITGDLNYKEKFKQAEDRLEAEGFKVMNPAVLPEGFTFAEYMNICKSMIDVCNIVYFLNDWTNSQGAIKEMGYAIAMGKELLFQA